MNISRRGLCAGALDLSLRLFPGIAAWLPKTLYAGR